MLNLTPNLSQADLSQYAVVDVAKKMAAISVNA